MRQRISFSAAGLSALLIFSCKTDVRTDGIPQITKNDVISLEGSFYDNFLESWDYIMLDDENLDGILGSLYKVLYDDGLYFIESTTARNSSIKVFDSTGHYLNDICQTGRARYEFLYIDEWTIDPYRNQVILLNRNGYYGTITIKRYDYQGHYIGQSETQALTDEYHIGQVIKCTSDGSILIENNLGITPVYEYFYICPDGTFSAPMGLNSNHMNLSDNDMELFNDNLVKAGDWCGISVREASYNVLSDTTVLMPKLDSHIYSLQSNRYDSIADLSCLPPIPDKKKNNLFYDTFHDGGDLAFIEEYRDYLRLRYNDRTEYVLDKTTFRMYRMKGDATRQSIPSYGNNTLYGNDIIYAVEPYQIRNILELIDDNDSEVTYSPDVIELFRKAKDRENPILIIAHYKLQH